MTVKIFVGDCREVLRSMPAESVHCCVTSPPYFGLRDYGVDGQMGLEATPDEFVAGMVRDNFLATLPDAERVRISRPENGRFPDGSWLAITRPWLVEIQAPDMPKPEFWTYATRQDARLAVSYARGEI